MHLIDVCGYTQDAVDTMWHTLETNMDGSISRDELRVGFARHKNLRNAPGMGMGHTQLCGRMLRSCLIQLTTMAPVRLTMTSFVTFCGASDMATMSLTASTQHWMLTMMDKSRGKS